MCMQVDGLKSYIPTSLKYVGNTLRVLAQNVHPTYFKAQGIQLALTYTIRRKYLDQPPHD